jgi:hypothetical protein
MTNASILSLLSGICYGLAVLLFFFVVLVVASDPATNVHFNQQSSQGGGAMIAALMPTLGLVITAALLGGASTALKDLQRIREATESSVDGPRT